METWSSIMAKNARTVRDLGQLGRHRVRIAMIVTVELITPLYSYQSLQLQKE